MGFDDTCQGPTPHGSDSGRTSSAYSQRQMAQVASSSELSCELANLGWVSYR